MNVNLKFSACGCTEDDSLPDYKREFKPYFNKDDYIEFHASLSSLDCIFREGEEHMTIYKTFIWIGLPITILGTLLFFTPFIISIFDENANIGQLFAMMGVGIFLICIGPCLVMLGRDNIRFTIDRFCEEYVGICNDFESSHNGIMVMPASEETSIAFIGRKIVSYNVEIWLLEPGRTKRMLRQKKRNNISNRN